MSLLDTASLIVTPNGYKGGVTTGKLYSVKPTDASGDMVVTRNTTATRVNSAGLIQSVAFNAPRIDYPPLGVCPSILVEPIRTNEFFYSEQFDNGYWEIINSTITANATFAPDGTMTADKFIPNTANSTHQIRKIALTSNAYTFSVFAKASGETTFSMWLLGASVRAEFNLSNGTIIINTATSAKIEPYPNGWYRCSVYSSTPGTTFQIYGRSGSIFVGNNVDGIFFWGAQAEVGTNATSYIPTTTIGVTRNADSIIKTGITNLIGQTEGTLYAEVIGTKEITANNKYICIIGGTKNIHIAFYASIINIVSSPIDISVAFTPNVNYKIAVRYLNTGNFRVYVNGVKTHEVNTYVGGTFNNLGIGNTIAGSSQVNSSINSVQLYKTALTHEQCIDLTT